MLCGSRDGLGVGRGGSARASSVASVSRAAGWWLLSLDWHPAGICHCQGWKEGRGYPYLTSSEAGMLHTNYNFQLPKVQVQVQLSCVGGPCLCFALSLSLSLVLQVKVQPHQL